MSSNVAQRLLQVDGDGENVIFLLSTGTKPRLNLERPDKETVRKTADLFICLLLNTIPFLTFLLFASCLLNQVECFKRQRLAFGVHLSSHLIILSGDVRKMRLAE